MNPLTATKAQEIVQVPLVGHDGILRKTPLSLQLLQKRLEMLFSLHDPEPRQGVDQAPSIPAHSVCSISRYVGPGEND